MRPRGSNGYIEKKGNAYHVRFRVDVPETGKRAYKSVRICPASGPGMLAEWDRERRAKEIVGEYGAITKEHALNLGTTFKQQAEWFMETIATRKRRPVKAATLKGWRNSIRKWLNPNLGSMALADVNNLAVKGLVETLATAGLGAKSISNHVKLVKMVVASALTEQGEPRYPRKWNAAFIDLPDVTSQHTPSFTSEAVTRIIATAEGWVRVLLALLAGTGLRVGELLALEVGDISADGLTLNIRQSVWCGQLQRPKTVNAVRLVDLHPALASMLKAYVGERSSGFLFTTKKGRPISQDSLRSRKLAPILEQLGLDGSFHSFRRFRITHLRRQRAPEDLIRYWVGHGNTSVTDLYDRVKDDRLYRLECAQNVGLGFDIPTESPVAVLFCTQTEAQEAAA